MRLHGLVLGTALLLSDVLLAQNGSGTTTDTFLPPSPRRTDDSKGEPLPLPLSITEPASSDDIEGELRQFRNELRAFQAMREEVARTTKTADADTERVSQQQRLELVELLTKLAKRGIARKLSNPPDPIEESPQPARIVPPVSVAPPSAVPTLPSTDSTTPDISVDIADAFSLGKVLFRTGDFVGAERAFRKASVTPENEMTIKYLLATCLRRQSKMQPAMEAYKAVANSNQDPVLRDLAKWQLENIRWLQQSEFQLEKMRQQREKRLDTTNGQSASIDGNRQ